MNNCYSRAVILIAFSLCLSFCANVNHNKEWENKVEKTIEYWHGKQIALPDSIEYVDNKSTFQVSIKEDTNSLKVVSYIDGNCSACVLNLLFWEKFISEVLLESSTCNFYILISAEDKNNFVKIADTYGYTYPWYFDKESSFIKKNEIWDKRFQTVLLNSKNEVILIGDPTNNEKLAKLYKDTILELSN